MSIVTFSFEDTPEAFHRAIVNAASHARHTWRQTSVQQFLVEDSAGVLVPAVTVEHNVTARKTMEEGGVQFCDNPDIDSFKKKLDIPAYYTRYASEAWYDQSLVDTIYNYGNK